MNSSWCRPCGSAARPVRGGISGLPERSGLCYVPDIPTKTTMETRQHVRRQVRRRARRQAGLHHGRHRRDGDATPSSKRAANRLAHLLRAHGLKRLDHYSIFMENNDRYLEACGAGERSGLYYTCVNSYLTADELAYILNNSESKVLITSRVAAARSRSRRSPQCPNVTLCLVVDGSGDDGPFSRLRAGGRRPCPSTPIADESAGHADALLVGHHRPARRASCGRCPRTRRRSRCRCSTSWSSCGSTARA